jgi:hypothetical protein
VAPPCRQGVQPGILRSPSAVEEDALNFDEDFFGDAGCQQFSEFCGRQWPAEVVALRFVAYVILQKKHFLLRFHALGHCPKLHVASHADDGGDDRGFIRGSGDLTDGWLVDFQRTDRKLPQVA